jgi:preprotein translocase subunit SecG
MSGILMGLITTLHILACVSLMVAILLQSGKGGGLAGTFGAGSSQTLFGGRGAATFLSRAAGTLAVVFFLTSLTLSLTSTRQGVAGGRSLITEEAKKRAGQGQRPAAESNTPPPLGGQTTPGQGLTPPAATPQAPPAATTAPAPTKTSAAPAKKAPVAQPKSASTTQPPAQEAPATNAPSTNTTAPTPPASTTTQGGQ